ncbi:competence protein ComK [Bacillus sp. Marseille-P3661]|uniref:competence protein ComK n=1 Tax=Bacillus sp. Marseille-P3661 TaxID=1936234 RepID=UPI000C82EDB5|nr:competence protein ComK [Bacillus sp. Marseille-P3661]
MKKVLDTYEVNRSTMALLSVAHIDYCCIALEDNQTLYVRQTPISIVKASCLDGGSTYDGRRTAVTHRTGSKHRVPIPINPNENIFAFPTHSPKAFECSWIFYHHVKSIKTFSSPTNHAIQTVITFQNGHQEILNESYYILKKQYQQTAICILAFAPQHRDSPSRLL